MRDGSNYLDPDRPGAVQLNVGEARALGERRPASDTAKTMPANQQRALRLPVRRSAAHPGIADASDRWCDNALRFANREEAAANVRDLMIRWFAVRETRVVESDDPVNYRYADGRLESLAPEAIYAK
jgi:hypothetical protein